MIELVPGGVKGKLTLPSSKSHTLRAILFASLATGTSRITSILSSPDTDAMIEACQTLGATINRSGDSLEIIGGINKNLKKAHIDAGNSGIVLRFMAAVFALLSAEVTITGDESCKTRRPCKPLLDALVQMGAKVTSNNFHAPITIQGPIFPSNVLLDGQDSQPVSAIMIAAIMIEGITHIEVQNMGEKPWLALTLDWLQRLGVSYKQTGSSSFSIEGKGSISAFDYRVPADLSSLSFPVVLALLTQSDLLIENVDLDDAQGDKVVLEILERMGATFLFEKKSIQIEGPQKLQGCVIDVNDCIDALPILAVVGCFADGTTHIFNGAIARKKESDRIAAMQKELTKMGAEVVELADGLFITKAELQGASLDAHKDHRVALSLAVAAFAAKGNSYLVGEDSINKTYKNFFLEIERLRGAVC